MRLRAGDVRLKVCCLESCKTGLIATRGLALSDLCKRRINEGRRRIVLDYVRSESCEGQSGS